MELSEYERKRLENIRQNQQVLQALEIPRLPLKRPTTSTTRPSVAVKGLKPKPDRTKPVEPKRRSTRIIEKITGVKDERAMAEPIPEPERRPKVPRPPRITTNVPFAPQIGATDDFLHCFQNQNVAMSEEKGEPTRHYRMLNEHCIIKAARDRIYSMAIHPHCDKIIACAGTKEGELAFWEGTQVIEKDYHVSDEWSPRAFLFAPHNGSVSNLRYNPLDHHKLLTTSYDGSCLVMDLTKGTFSPWHQMSRDDGAVVTGFDIHDDHLAYFSDTAGVLRVTDLRTNDTITVCHLHDTKIGGVSVSADGAVLATASNDRSVALWDLRKLSDGKNTCLFKHEFKNAVTAVNFHPCQKSKFVTTCYDDTVRIFDTNGGGEVVKINHNNQTGRWITLFKAIWDPKSTTDSSVIAIGNMEQRGVDLYDGESGEWLECATGEWLTAQPAVNAIHPRLPVMVSGNASGKMVIWS